MRIVAPLMTMPTRTLTATLALVAALVLAGGPPSGRAAPRLGQDDNGHGALWRIMRQARGTPDARGLLPTAIREAQIVTQQAALVTSAGTLEQMQRHAGHVLHALDPGELETGAGFGYGVRRALTEMASAADLAAAAPQASAGLRASARLVALNAGQAVARTDELVRVARALRTAASPAAAAPLVEELRALRRQLFAGADTNRDGIVAWDDGEGGLTELQERLVLLLASEGIR